MGKCLLLMFLWLSVTACSRNSGASITPDATFPVLHFPQQINTPIVYMEALIQGELVFVNGCLRVNNTDGDSILLIWRPGFSSRVEQETVKIIDSNTNDVLASVGDSVSVGGGFDDNPTWMGLKEPLPEECPGPYFIVGESIKKIEQP